MARCHMAAFPKTLSTAMGQNYVEKMLEWYLVDDRAFIFYLEESGKCIGYCGGLKVEGLSRVGSASSMIQYSYNEAVKALLSRPWLFLHREFVLKYRLVLKNVINRISKKFRFGTTKSVTRRHTDPHTGLIVIGVDPAFQGKGYGSLLLKEFEKISSALGHEQMMLTVRTDNVQAIRSYSKNGWLVTYQDRKSTTMEKRIDQSPIFEKTKS